MEFVKSHGAGNDFVLIADLDDRLGTLPAPLIATLCDRHRGVGADGLIRIAPDAGADFFMDYYNADGGVAEMCGNGIRCLAKYVADRGLIAGDTLRVGSRGGTKELVLYRDADGLVERVRVDMGPPEFDRARIPLAGVGDPLHQSITVAGSDLVAACVSMGNPHCVVFVDRLEGVDVEHLGPAVETHPLFPAKTNVEFTEVLDRRNVRVRVWERGVGETQACGTGACATGVAASLRGLTDRLVNVHFPGGTVEVAWTDHTVFLTGPAVEVFRGTLDPHVERAMPAASTR